MFKTALVSLGALLLSKGALALEVPEALSKTPNLYALTIEIAGYPAANKLFESWTARESEYLLRHCPWLWHMKEDSQRKKHVPLGKVEVLVNALRESYRVSKLRQAARAISGSQVMNREALELFNPESPLGGVLYVVRGGVLEVHGVAQLEGSNSFGIDSIQVETWEGSRLRLETFGSEQILYRHPFIRPQNEPISFLKLAHIALAWMKRFSGIGAVNRDTGLPHLDVLDLRVLLLNWDRLNPSSPDLGSADKFEQHLALETDLQIECQAKIAAKQ